MNAAVLFGRRDGRVRALGALMVMLGLFGSLLGPNPAYAARSDEAAPLDLAAMVLSPADLEAGGLEGYGRATPDALAAMDGRYLRVVPVPGWLVLSEAADASLTAAVFGSQADRGQLYFDLHATGWQRQFQRVLAKPHGSDFGGVVVSTIGQYPNAEAAEAAFALLTQTNGEDVVEVAGAARVGDRSRLVVLPNEAALTFRIGNLVAGVQVMALAQPGAEVAAAEALAARLAERIDDVSAGERAGLGGAALRLAVPEAPLRDEYSRLDGETFPLIGESAEDRAAREAWYGDATEVYLLTQTLPLGYKGTAGTMVYFATLRRFPDDEAAAAWLADLPELVAADVASGDLLAAEIVDDAPEVGEESLTFATEWEWDGETFHSIDIYARVGAEVAMTGVVALEEPPLDGVAALAATQADCLKAASCPEPASPPAGLAGLPCPETPADEAAATETEPASADVAMGGADSAHSGVRPGPGPAGEPELRWRFAAGDKITAAPVVADGVVYAGSYDGNRYAVDAASGALRWCVHTGGLLSERQAVGGGLVVGSHADPRTGGVSAIGVPGDAVVALDAATGTERWRFHTGGHIDDVVVADDTVFVGSWDGGLLALDLATGEGRWRFQVDPESEYGTASVHRLVVAGDIVYAGADMALYAVDVATGEELWRFVGDSVPEHPTFALAVAGGLVFAHDFERVYALDAATGEERWRFAVERGWPGTAAVADGVLYVGGRLAADAEEDSAILYALDVEEGRELWSFAAEGYLADPAVVDGVVYVGSGLESSEDFSTRGTVYALDADSGEEIWSLPIDGAATGPAVVGGVVYVGTDNPEPGEPGALYAIGGADAGDSLGRHEQEVGGHRPGGKQEAWHTAAPRASAPIATQAHGE